jgi:drug/metabolite transporter (DMT)-like permease
MKKRLKAVGAAMFTTWVLYFPAIIIYGNLNKWEYSHMLNMTVGVFFCSLFIAIAAYAVFLAWAYALED